jgi:hypothetical protein
VQKQSYIYISYAVISSMPQYRTPKHRRLKPDPDLSILPQRNSITKSAGFCSTRGVGSNNTARIPANELRTLINQLFAAPGGKMSSLQVASAAFIFVNHILSRSSAYAKEVRDELAQYLQNEGRILWQDSYS